MKVLVTGAAGFVGYHTSELLLKNGYKVVGLDNFNSYYPKILKEKNAKDLKGMGAEFFDLDLATDDLSSAISGVEYAVHLAAQPGISNTVSFGDYERNNILATENLLNQLDGSKDLKLFINAATSSVYGYFADDSEEVAPKPASYYGVTKLAAEQLVMFRQRTFGFPGSSFRLFSVTGPRDRPHDKLFTKLIRATLEANQPPVSIYKGSEEHKRSYTPASDIAKAFLVGIQNPKKCVGEIFNIGTSQIITTGEAMQALEKALGKPLNIKQVETTRVGDQKVTAAKNDKVKKVLGWEAQSTTEQALKEAVDWYKSDILDKIQLDL